MVFAFRTTNTTAFLLEYGPHRYPKRPAILYTHGSSLNSSTRKAYLSATRGIMPTCCRKSLDWKVAKLTTDWWPICGISSWSGTESIKSTTRPRVCMWVKSLLFIWKFSVCWSIRSISIRWCKCLGLRLYRKSLRRTINWEKEPSFQVEGSTSSLFCRKATNKSLSKTS